MTVCRVPPAGWRCTREAGHDGPCAAIPTEPPFGFGALPGDPRIVPMASVDDIADVEMDDEHDDEGVYCECGAFHDQDELGWNKCACCGLPIDINDEAV